MHRSHTLRWLALAVAVVSFQCVESLSDDCRKTRTCEPAPQLGPDCRWRYPDGGVWEGGPQPTEGGVWVWPDGTRTATQRLACPLDVTIAGDAGAPVNTDNCPEIPCEAGLMCDEASHRCVRCQDDTQCVEASDSRGALPFCDTRIHDCVACLTDASCREGQHCKVDYANPKNNQCVGCVNNEQCPTDSPICDPATNACTALCSEPDSKCTKAPKRICSSPTNGLCVECLDNSHCASPTPQCNTFRKECVTCVDNAACTNGLVCSSGNKCVQCVDDSTCGGGTHCDVVTNTCVECVDSSQCTAAENSRCNAQRQCAPCTDSSQCEGTKGVCNIAGGGVCVQCVDDSTCGANQACDVTNGTCVGCVDNADCNLDPTLARCDTLAHTCAPCGSPSQCEGKFGNKNICRTPGNNGECVECLGNGDCAGDAARSKCNLSSGVCGACQVDGDCGAVNGKHACALNGGARCVECTSATHCVGNAKGPACNTANNSCVECVADTDCTSAGASRCVNNQCVACVNDGGGDHCDHILNGQTQLGVCDESGGAGVCVQCTGKSRAACGTNVCNSQTKQCSPFPAGSAGLCTDCVSDAHCGTNQRCLQETFGATSLGFSCFPLDVAGDCPQTPFAGLATVTTIDGDSEPVCLLRRTTCAGFIQANNNPCTVNADCGEANQDDGRCDTNAGVCSLPCTSGVDCPSGDNASCLGGICQL